MSGSHYHRMPGGDGTGIGTGTRPNASSAARAAVDIGSASLSAGDGFEVEVVPSDGDGGATLMADYDPFPDQEFDRDSEDPGCWARLTKRLKDYRNPPIYEEEFAEVAREANLMERGGVEEELEPQGLTFGQYVVNNLHSGMYRGIMRGFESMVLGGGVASTYGAIYNASTSGGNLVKYTNRVFYPAAGAFAGLMLLKHMKDLYELTQSEQGLPNHNKGFRAFVKANIPQDFEKFKEMVVGVGASKDFVTVSSVLGLLSSLFTNSYLGLGMGTQAAIGYTVHRLAKAYQNSDQAAEVEASHAANMMEQGRTGEVKRQRAQSDPSSITVSSF